ncbi:guanylyl cyclase-activating protein 2-like [Aplochiton taeniatus]
MGQTDSQSEVEREVALQHIQELYRKFATECPSGKLHLHEFKKIFGVSCTSSEEESDFMNTLFRTFDTNEDGSLDFMEYVAALHLVLRGKLEDKLKWSFKVYDKDGNGRLDRYEMKHILRIICKLRSHTNPSADMNVNDICDRIFELVDKNKDGEITLEEFMDGAQKDPWVLEQLQLDIRPRGWFLEQQQNKP